mmetsp:Transcript_14184/g.25190  ORF Transcript_14184/g.25190 Transcript_14184/m.25190 type:complete len:81 (+) Transcript_14184:2973-3215(+)
MIILGNASRSVTSQDNLLGDLLGILSASGTYDTECHYQETGNHSVTSLDELGYLTYSRTITALFVMTIRTCTYTTRPLLH